MAEEETSAENEEDLWAAAADDLAQQREMLRETAAHPHQDSEEKKEDSATAVASAEPAPAPAPPAATADPGEPGDINRMLEIPLQISVELGRTKMLINDLLQLGQGSVIELSKLVGDPLEVLVNDRLVARGEVVVVNEKFGVRITEISSPTDRIQSMS